MIKKFNDIEKNYPIEDITHEDEKIWAYMRVAYYWKSIEALTKSYTESSKKSKIQIFFKYASQSLYGFKNWFRKYDYVIISDTEGIINVNNKNIDKNYEKIIDILGKEKCLYIDTPNPSHIEMKKLSTKYLVSRRFLDLMHRVIFYIYRTFKTVDNIELLDTINSKTYVKINYKDVIRKFNSEKFLFKFLFKVYKPKVAFINCYYCNQAIVKAANELNIATVEVQHGQIGYKHFAYNITKPVDNSFYPKYLLTFGEFEKKILQNNLFNPFNNIIPVGRFYLEDISKQKAPQKLQDTINKYNITVSVSTQYTVEDKLAYFIKEYASQHTDVAFLLSLRHYDKEYYKKFDMPKNVMLYQGEYSCYEILNASDFHMTSYSTCAIEAQFFKKVSILVDIDGMAKANMGDLEGNNIHIVSKQEELNSIFSQKFNSDKSDYYVHDYLQNINKFLKKEMV